MIRIVYKHFLLYTYCKPFCINRGSKNTESENECFKVFIWSPYNYNYSDGKISIFFIFIYMTFIRSPKTY